ncbi:MAG: hypothetical protein QNJ90_16655 [Planctomycetota bacterium]|nr:hypothetical protein [Planctomycetota bacterium]
MALFLAINPDPYEFACDGPLLGIPHFWNVVTNLAFLVVGWWGLRYLRRRGLALSPAFRNWTGVWVSSVVLCFTSGAYHWFLTPWGLAVDRVAICGIIAFVTAHLIHVVLGRGPSLRISLGLLLLCEATVVVWVLGGSPWWYGALQAIAGFGALALVIAAHARGRLSFSPKPVYLFCGWYAVAKLLELFDVPICEALGFMGGHPWKHVASAIGLWCLGRMMVAEAETGEGATPAPASPPR